MWFARNTLKTALFAKTVAFQRKKVGPHGVIRQLELLG